MSTVEWISLITKSFIKNINHKNYFITHVISNSMVLLNLLVHKISILIPIPETTVDKSNGINAVCHRWTSSPYGSMLSSSALTYIISAHHLCLLTF